MKLLEEIYKLYKDNDTFSIKKFIKDNKQEIGETFYNLIKEEGKYEVKGKDELINIVNYLFDNGYKFDYQNENGHTVLSAALYKSKNNMELYKVLIKNPALITMEASNSVFDEVKGTKSKKFDSPLRTAFILGIPDLAELFITNATDDINDELIAGEIYEKESFPDDYDKYWDTVYPTYLYYAFEGYCPASTIEVLLNNSKFVLDEKNQEMIKHIQMEDCDIESCEIEEKKKVVEKYLKKNNKDSAKESKKSDTKSSDDFEELLDDFYKNTFKSKILDPIEEYLEDDTFGDTFNLWLSIVLFAIGVSINGDNGEEFKDAINDTVIGGNDTFESTTDTYINDMCTLGDIEERILPFFGAVLQLLSVNKELDYETDVKDKLLEIIDAWTLKYNDNQLPKTSIYKKTVKAIKDFTPVVDDETEVSSSMESNVVTKSKNGCKPAELVEMGAAIQREEYINAPDAFRVYLGADIRNPNKDFTIENLKFSVSFYNDGMIVDTQEVNIRFIDVDSVLHFAYRFYVREEFEKYTVRINGGDFYPSDGKINLEEMFAVSNLKHKVDSYNDETKISCQLDCNCPQDVRSLDVYVQLKKNGKIVGGECLSKYDLSYGGVYALVETLDIAVDSDELAYSVNPWL